MQYMVYDFVGVGFWQFGDDLNFVGFGNWFNFFDYDLNQFFVESIFIFDIVRDNYVSVDALIFDIVWIVYYG